MKRKTTFVLSAVLLAAVGAAAGVHFWQASHVQTAQVKRASIKEAIYGIGTVVSKFHFTYKVSMMKTIARIYVREGDIVNPGQPLMLVVETGTVRSPIRGIVTFLPYSAGENTTPDSPMVIVQNLNDRYIKASLEQQSALRVTKGLRATLSFENMRGQIIEGLVQSIFSKDSQFYAIIDVKNLPPQILPDMTADVAIQVAEKKDVLLIPIRALSAGYVTKLEEKRRLKIPVTVGLADEQWAEIIGGELHEGDVLLLPGR